MSRIRFFSARTKELNMFRIGNIQGWTLPGQDDLIFSERGVGDGILTYFAFIVTAILGNE